MRPRSPAREGGDGSAGWSVAPWRLDRYRGRLFLLLVTILLLFAISEYVQARWLARVGRLYPHLSQIAQGVASTLICALLLEWVVGKGSPLPLPATSSADNWLDGTTRSETEPSRKFAAWFIRVRWVAIAVSAALVASAIYVLRLLPREAAGPLAWTLVGLTASNVFYRVLFRRHGMSRLFLPLQVVSDLCFFVLLLHFSGGIENPLSLLMVLHVIIAGAALLRWQCYAVAAFAMALLAMLSWAEWQGWAAHYPLLIFSDMGLEPGMVAHRGESVLALIALHGAIFFITAFFVTTLAERVRYDERQLVSVAGRAIEARRLLERALETTGTGLRVLDRELRPYWCSAAWLRWFDADVPAAPTAMETLDSREVRVIDKVVTMPSADGQLARGEQEVERAVQLTTAPLLGESGAVDQIVELFQDVTSQRQMQAQAMRAEKLAAVGTLAGQMAHEINNPIAIISAKARLLLQDRAGEISSEVARELGKIVDHADRVAHIAQGLLSYCRPSPGLRMSLNLCGPVRKALDAVGRRAGASRVTIEDELPDSMPSVCVNDFEMQQVFLNLFLNALDAMAGGGTMRITGRHVNGQAEVVVSDTGPGISLAIRGRIFEPFVTTKADGRGTGLGLSICQGLVRSHGGEIRVESEEGRGSRFIVRLPIAATAPPEPCRRISDVEDAHPHRR